MHKLQAALQISLVLSFSLTPCQAVPSLICVPKNTMATSPEVSDNQKQYQATTRKIRIYYVNGHRQWEAKAQVVNGQVKAILFGAKRNRPFASSKIDNNGFGRGIDFRGQPWEFHGYLDP
ncbi:MAG: hypothetical protein WC714_27885 [Candidatus Obscuribacterales bacterium]